MINLQRLFYFLTDIQIYEYFCSQEIIPGNKITSPFPGRKDPNPSLTFFVGDNNRVYWKDFGRHDPEYSDSVGFVQELLGLERQEAIDHIFKTLVVEGKSPEQRPLIKVDKVPPVLEWREISPPEMWYWEQFGITPKTLDKFNVKAVESWSLNGKLAYKSTPKIPVFCYLNELVEDPDIYKIYSPLAPDKLNKFRGINNGKIIEGWDQLLGEDFSGGGKYLIISKSLKDTMVMNELGLPSCNPTSENSLGEIIKRSDEIDSRFQKKFIFFDNDEPGKIASSNLNDSTGWAEICLPPEWAKDPSDLVKLDGNYDRLKQFLKENLK